MPSSSFEMGAIPPSPVGFASGLRDGIAPISQDSDGIGQCVLARHTALYQCWAEYSAWQCSAVLGIVEQWWAVHGSAPSQGVG